MSWSDDTRCLYCDGKLPLYRKITSGQFCCAVHRKSYWQEQERLAVERLHQTHDSLRAYRPPEALEAPHRATVAAKAVTPEPPPAPSPAARNFVEYQDGPSTDDRARSSANTGQVTFGELQVEAKPAPVRSETLETAAAGIHRAESSWIDDFAARIWAMPPFAAELDTPEWSMTEAPVEAGPGMGAPVPFFRASAVSSSDVAWLKESPVRLLASPAIKNVDVSVRFAATLETAEFAPGFVPEAAEVAENEEEPGPAMAAMVPLPRTTATPIEFAARTGEPGMLSRATGEVSYARLPSQFAAAQAALEQTAGLVALSLMASSRPQEMPLRGADASAVDLSLTLDRPRRELDLPALAVALRFAPGSRYAISRKVGFGPVVGSPSEFLALKTSRLQIAGLQPRTGLSLAPGCKYAVAINPGQIEKASIRQANAAPVPAKSAVVMAAMPAGVGDREFSPALPSMRPLAFEAQAKSAAPARPMTASVIYTYAENSPRQPVAKREPIEGLMQPPPKTGFLSSWSQAMDQIGQNRLGENGDGEKKYVWSHVADFWQHAPRDLKLLSIAIPILLGLALRPSLPKLKVTAPVASNVVHVQGSSFERDLRERLLVVRQTVAERAGVELNEDFRAGLDDWQTRGDLSTAWSFDRNGFVQPGALALYRPSLGLKDYQMEFLGLIDKKALSWVVRAADFDNYYVVKLVVLKAGPMPTLGITRYAVINGKAQNRVDTVAALNTRTDTLYRVNLDIHDDTYLLTLQGQIVDNWTEPRLSSGGVGFFSQQGEESRLRWVQVTHQYDMLGRLCAYLAPYNLSNN